MRHPSIERLIESGPENLEHLERCLDCRQIAEMMGLELAPPPPATGPAVEPPLVERSVFTGWQALPDGRGGMGELWCAFDRRLGRQVAVKQVRAAGVPGSALHASLLRRLEREARLTARLQHPAIVAVYEVGRFPDGELFYCMPLVPGRQLAQEIDARPTLERRLGLLPQLTSVAEAIAYSHEKGVLHRDIKPHNILVGAFGEAVVIDWGLAKEIGAPDADDGPAAAEEPADGLTQLGVGTPQYMAPEQARGDRPTALVDVYALGATLYHALCGEPPYGFGGAREVRGRLMAGAPRALEERVPEVPAELAHICARAMERDPARRYPSARAFADDLRSFQTGRLLQSRRYTPAELVRHFVRRWRLPLAVAAAALVLLIALTVIGVVNVERHRRLAEENRARAEWSLRRAEGVLASRLSAEAPRRLEAVALGVRAVGPELTGAVPGAPAAEAVQGLFDALTAGPAPLALGHGGAITDFAVSPDGAVLAGTGDDRTVVLWDARSGRRLATLASELGLPHQIRFSPAGDRLSLCGPEARGELHRIAGAVRTGFVSGGVLAGCEFLPGGALITAADELAVRDPATAEVRKRLPLPVRAGALAVGATGRVAVAGLDGSLRLWEPEGGALQLLAGSGATPTSLAFDPAGRRLALVSRDGSVRLYAEGAGGFAEERRAQGGEGHAYASRARFSPGGGRLAVPLWSEEEVRTHLFDTASGARTASAAVFAQAWAGPDRFLADARGRFLLVDAGDGRTALELTGHRDEIKAAAWLGDAAASASRDGAEYLWDLRPGAASGLLLGHTGELTAAAWSPARDRLLSAGLDGSLRIWSAAEGRELAAARARGGLTSAAWSPDGAAVLAGGLDGAVLLLELRTGERRTVFQADGPVTVARFLDGRRALCGALDGRLAVLDLGGGPVVRLGPAGGAVLAAAASPSGRSVVSAHADGSARLWDAASGAQRALLADQDPFDEPGDRQGHASVFFSGEERVLLGRPYGRTWVVGAADLQRRGVLEGRAASASGEPLSPDGRRFAAVAPDGRVLIHDLATGASTALAGHRGAVLATSFSADGRLLATGGLDGTVRLFEVESGRALVRLEAALGPATAVAAGEGGRPLAAGYGSGALRLHPATPAAALERACATLQRFGREQDAAPYCDSRTEKSRKERNER